MWTVLGAPFDSAGAGRGEERAPGALRAAGLPALFGAADAGDAAPPLRGPERDAETGLIAYRALIESSLKLGAAVAAVVERGDRPLVLGGDCTLLLGAIAGARGTIGPLGLWFVDGHADYLDGHSSPTGEAADMELAILTGDGPPELVDLAGEPPAIDSEAVVVLGHRPPGLDPGVALELERVPPELARLSADEIAAQGPGEVGELWERRLAARGYAWLHLDLDALDETALPAVTYPQPHGLDWPGFVALIRPLLASEALAGVSIADFNPDLDPDGAHASRVVEALAEAIADHR
jgi:arginase